MTFSASSSTVLLEVDICLESMLDDVEVMVATGDVIINAPTTPAPHAASFGDALPSKEVKISEEPEVTQTPIIWLSDPDDDEEEIDESLFVRGIDKPLSPIVVDPKSQSLPNCHNFSRRSSDYSIDFVKLDENGHPPNWSKPGLRQRAKDRIDVLRQNLASLTSCCKGRVPGVVKESSELDPSTYYGSDWTSVTLSPYQSDGVATPFWWRFWKEDKTPAQTTHSAASSPSRAEIKKKKKSILSSAKSWFQKTRSNFRKKQRNHVMVPTTLAFFTLKPFYFKMK